MNTYELSTQAKRCHSEYHLDFFRGDELGRHQRAGRGNRRQSNMRHFVVDGEEEFARAPRTLIAAVLVLLKTK